MSTEHEHDPQTQDPNWKQVRELIDELKNENKQLRAEAMDGKVRALGLDPEKGVVKLALKEFVSTAEDQSTPALKSFMADLGLVEGESQDPSSTPETPLTPPNQGDLDKQGQAAELGRRHVQLQAAGTPPAPEPDINQRIADAEAAGDWQTAITLKLQSAEPVLGMNA